MSTLEEIKARIDGHTPGPWEAVRGEWGTSNKRLTMLWAGQRDENEFMVATAFAESKADAELIAAAPKLLAALEAVLNLANHEPRFRPRMYGGEYFPVSVSADEIIEVITEALQ